MTIEPFRSAILMIPFAFLVACTVGDDPQHPSSTDELGDAVAISNEDDEDPGYDALARPDPDAPVLACKSDTECDSARLCWQGFCRLKTRNFHPGSCTAHGCRADHFGTAEKRCADLGYLRAAAQQSWQVAGDQIFVGQWTGINWKRKTVGGGRAMQRITCTRLTPEQQRLAPAVCRRKYVVQSNCDWFPSHTVDEDWTGQDPSECTTTFGPTPPDNNCYLVHWEVSAKYFLL